MNRIDLPLAVRKNQELKNKLSNEARTDWIVSQAAHGEKPTGNQTGTILEGETSLVYLYVTGSGLARPFRVFRCNKSFPYYVMLDVFDEQFSEFNKTLIHWTKALHQIRVTSARYPVKAVLWGDDFKGGLTFAKWDRMTRDDRYRVTNIYGDPFMEELPAIPGKEAEHWPLLSNSDADYRGRD